MPNLHSQHMYLAKSTFCLFSTYSSPFKSQINNLVFLELFDVYFPKVRPYIFQKKDHASSRAHVRARIHTLAYMYIYY